MLNKIATLHALCFPRNPWSADEFAKLQQQGCEIIASQNGFIVYRTTIDESEIITIGVAPDARRGGVASAMLALAERDAKSHGAKKMFLEVEITNAPARALYESAGYTAVGTRPKYYNGIDGIIMSKDL